MELELAIGVISIPHIATFVTENKANHKNIN